MFRVTIMTKPHYVLHTCILVTSLKSPNSNTGIGPLPPGSESKCDCGGSFFDTAPGLYTGRGPRAVGSEEALR